MTTPEPFLSSETYRAREAEAMDAIGVRAIQAFSPITFAAVGMPTRALTERGLQRYVDNLFVGKAIAYWTERFAVSEHEAKLVQDACALAEELTGERFGRSIRPVFTTVKSLELYRLVTSLAQAVGRPLRILEIGPGSGYVGLYLGLAGHQCLLMDNAEGYYLWQNRLFRRAFGDHFVETVETGRAPERYLDGGATIVHLPWWDFVELFEAEKLPAIDLVIAEDMLGEMDRIGLRYTLRLSSRLLRGGSPGLFAYVSPGMQFVSKVKDIHTEFCRAGFHNVRGQDFWLYAAPDTEFFRYGEGEKLRISPTPGLEQVSPSAPVPGPGSRTLDVRDVIDLPRDLTTHDYRFLEATGVEHPFGPRRG
ncbi:hypothetical protein GCM10017083_32480 [Thalassobaculum fulvum]|uniref:Uncharacterized protein n=1 Tax=Thalassobaculum fulvum TaxID=1633335 RepID=A0A918XU69_9PROT|nr:hypothetical protein [Thalassobaculum fulvum]GHD54682.1 hypothetical protein GCM10017083_32480 [Thalassobaculum fulvum]